MKYTHVFSISRYYRSCTTWGANAKTKEVVGRSRISFDKGVPIEKRYEEISKFLGQHDIKCPPFESNRKR